MGELRLYAVGMAEVRDIIGAPPAAAARLREIAHRCLAPAAAPAGTGLLGRLGPLFKRVPATPVVSPTQPEPADVDALLAGAYIPPARMGATWRLLETLVSGIAWGSTRVGLEPQSLDELDFALARGGVSAAVGIRHLLSTATSLNLIPVEGLTVGWHPYEKALAMAGVYRSALPQIESEEQRDLVDALCTWLDAFIPWAQAAPSLGRPVPDLVGFWAQ